MRRYAQAAVVVTAVMAGGVCGGAQQPQAGAAGTSQVQEKPSGTSQAPASGATQVAPLQLRGLDGQGASDPFPPVNPKNFTATTPTVDAVNAFLTQLWGYDAKRVWRVAAIQTTQAPGVSHVTVLVADKGSNAKVQPTAFYVLPDGTHAIAGDAVMSFGAKPFAATRARLAAEADGPSRGAAGKELELVEFADMQCPHCKEAQSSMLQLEKDFPKAHIVYQNFPLAALHPFATKAAIYGVCVTEQKPGAFWTYLQAVYDTQGGLTTEDGDKTLTAAVTKAGVDAAAVATCASGSEAQGKVLKSVQLAQQIGVDQTPTLAVNGRLVPVSPAAISYETLKGIVQFEAAQDGVR